MNCPQDNIIFPARETCYRGVLKLFEAIYLHCFTINNAFYAEKQKKFWKVIIKSPLRVWKDQSTVHETPQLLQISL